MSAELVIPTNRELEALAPAERWSLEDALEDAQGVLREFNDEELRHWVEVEGKTRREIAETVGRSHQRITQRCQRLGIQSQDNRGGSQTLATPSQNDDGELVEGEVVDPPVPRRRNGSPSEGPTNYFPDIVAPDAEQNLRTQALHWFGQGAHIKELLDRKRPLEPRSAEDRKAIRLSAIAMERVARRLKEACQ